MRRLVTQFDVRRSRATVATPTCCSCCCCVATLLTSTAVTVLNVHELVAQTPMAPSRRWLLRIAGLVTLPAAIALGWAAGAAASAVDDTLVGWAALLGFLTGWPALLTLLYRGLGLRSSGRVVAISVVSGIALFIAEFLAFLFIIAASPWLYLAFAVGLPFALVPLVRRWVAEPESP